MRSEGMSVATPSESNTTGGQPGESKAVMIDMSPDQQILRIETPQLFGYAVFLMIIALGFVVGAIYEFFLKPDPNSVFVDPAFRSFQDDGNDGVAALLVALGVLCWAAYDLHRGSRFETTLDRTTQSITVRSSCVGLNAATVNVPLSSITGTRLVGINDRFSAYAKLVADQNHGTVQLTGKTDVPAADQAQKAVARFLDLD